MENPIYSSLKCIFFTTDLEDFHLNNFHSSLPDDLTFRNFQTELCSHTGATCLKSATVRVETNGVNESLSLTKDVAPEAHNLKTMTLRDHFLFITVDLVGAGIHIFWDKKTWVYVKLDEKWQKKV